MKRQIEFRGKRKDGVWVYGSLVIGTDGETTYIFTSEGAQWNVFRETVGQYTGLNDQNEKKIYEGDKVVHGSESQYTGEITFLNGGFGTGLFHMEDIISCCEVFGNIHE